MRKNAGFGLLLVMLTAVLALVWGQGAAAADGDAREVKIGLLYPLSGSSADVGRDLVAGAQLAADIVNGFMPDLPTGMAQDEGIRSMGHARIKLVVADTGGDSLQAMNQAKRLIEQEKVAGIMGCYSSNITRVVASLCDSKGVPMLTACSTDPELTREGKEWLWRTTPTDEMFVDDMFDFINGVIAGKAPGVAAVGRVDMQVMASACRDDSWGVANSRLIRMQAGRQGFSLNASVVYAPDMPDQMTTARRLKQALPACVLIAAYAHDAVDILRAMQAVHLQPKLIWGQGAGFLSEEFRALGPEVEGVCARTVFSAQMSRRFPLANRVNELFEQRVGHNMNGNSARAFTGIQTWWAILEKAGSARAEDIREAASKINIPGDELIVPWKGVRFGTVLNEPGQNGQGRGLIGQYQIKGGAAVLEIIYPFDLATAKMIFPMPCR